MAPQKMIIDVDTGHDDAQALMLALAREDVQVLAITCCHGNVSLDKVCRNTLRVLNMCGHLEIPVYRGAPSQLLPSDENIADLFGTKYHGDDGLGDVPDNNPVTDDVIQTEHAVNALVRLVKENPNEITMVGLAPLTNIALAIKLDPGFGNNLRRCIIMGGNIEGKGNTVPWAEYNFYADPEAAHIVLSELSTPIELVSWETCLHNALSWEWFDRWIDTDSQKGRFNKAITAKGVHLNRNIDKIPVYRTCDPLAMAAAVAETSILESVTVFGCIEVGGRCSRGALHVDWNNRLKKKPNLKILLKINNKMYAKFMEDMIK